MFANPGPPIRSDGLIKLLYVGRLHKLKGVEYLLSALGELKETHSNPKLKIIGKDEGEGAKLHRMAAGLGLDVDFAGVVSEADKEAAYQWCDVLVLPTLSENFGLVVAEALERGKRVIATDGAPAWNHEIHETHERGVWSGYGGRLVYLKGYRDGTDEERVRLLKNAIEEFTCRS